MEQNAIPPIRIFYSYSHVDDDYREELAKVLSPLEREKLIETWFDGRVLAGQNIGPEIWDAMDHAQIVVFLLSHDFLASEACIEEWEYAQSKHTKGKMIFRIPIIVRTCSWKYLLDEDDVKALPKDANPISTYEDTDAAWKEVYDGIKNVVESIRSTLTPKQEFLDEIEKTEFLSQHNIRLQDIFVFLDLVSGEIEEPELIQKTSIRDREGLLSLDKVVIHGDEKSGKTALARYLYLSLVEDSKPALLMNLEDLRGEPREIRFREAFQEQFYGDYDNWRGQPNKTLILDNLTRVPRHMRLVELAKKHFERVIVLVSTDILTSSFLWDDPRLTHFRVLQISSLSHVQQAVLIEKRYKLMSEGQQVNEATIDHMERQVNSVIISERILPRYPFYVPFYFTDL